MAETPHSDELGRSGAQFVAEMPHPDDCTDEAEDRHERGVRYDLNAALTTSFASACTSARWSQPRNDSA